MISSFLSDPDGTLRQVLLMLPGLLLALCLHESAHGYIAERCGDPTARNLGRITLNPAKHFDLAGFLCMLFIGIGWAKPVPVNPNNFRSYRRDDLRVSLAGITANLCLFLVSFLILSLLFTGAVASLPQYDSWQEGYLATDGEGPYRYTAGEETRVYTSLGYIDAESLFTYSPYLYDEIIEPAFGTIVSLLYQMLMYCMLLNLSLAVFNLIPLPPLDGYHVLNDLVLKQDLFAQRRTARIAGGILVALILLGNYIPSLDIISIAIDWVRETALSFLSVPIRLFAQFIGVI